MDGRPKHLEDEIDVKIFDSSHFLLPVQFYFMLYPKQPFFHLPWMGGRRVDVTQRRLPREDWSQKGSYYITGDERGWKKRPKYEWSVVKQL